MMISRSRFKLIILWLQIQNRNVKYAVVVGADFCVLSMAVIASFMLRLSSFALPDLRSFILYLLGPIFSIAAATVAGVYGSVLRTYSSDTEFKIFRSQIAVPPIWALALLLLGSTGIARSVVIIYFLLAIGAMIGLRRLVAWFVRDQSSYYRKKERIPVVVYGAGTEGVAVVEELLKQGKFIPLAFLETDYTLLDRSVAGLPVYSFANLEQVISRFNPREIFVAKSGQTRSSRRAILDMCMSKGLLAKIIPDVSELVNGKIDLSQMRPVKVEDLLGRDFVKPDKLLMEKAIKSNVIMVTGAGGSIGSELVRQALTYKPRSIILVDHSEFSLFEIHRDIELQVSISGQATSLVPILADVSNPDTMDILLAKYRTDVVLHAAAYKHVRMVQENAIAGIKNNVWGTRSVAEAAQKNNVKLFVLISTDKAVRPTSIMGASKRVAEMVVQGLSQLSNSKTIFAIVRFGNVLGSTGSVVPLFNRQIANGGPVTVTHPDVRRYFMLIPEAAQLVIQAAAMAKGGEVFVLDMGEPVKIVDLAETMIELAGMTRKTETVPEGDIEIKFTSLHDGEKIYEELQIGRDIQNTEHSRIMLSNEFHIAWENLKPELAAIDEKLKRGKMKQASDHIFQLALRER